MCKQIKQILITISNFVNKLWICKKIIINKIFFSQFFFRLVIRFLFLLLDNLSYYLYGIKFSDLIILPKYDEWGKGAGGAGTFYKSWKPEDVKLMNKHAGGWPVPITEGWIPMDLTGVTDEEGVYRASLDNLFLNYRLDEQFRCILFVLGTVIFLGIIISDGNIPPPAAGTGTIVPA